MPNVAWAAVKAGHKVTILVDASAVTSVTKGVGWFRELIGSDTTALDRAAWPERERQSLSEQMGVPLEEIPHNYGEHFDFLKNQLGVEIYGNRTIDKKRDAAYYPSSLRPLSLRTIFPGCSVFGMRWVGRKARPAMSVGTTALAITAATRKEYCSCVTNPCANP